MRGNPVYLKYTGMPYEGNERPWRRFAVSERLSSLGSGRRCGNITAIEIMAGAVITGSLPPH